MAPQQPVPGPARGGGGQAEGRGQHAGIRDTQVCTLCHYLRICLYLGRVIMMTYLKVLYSGDESIIDIFVSYILSYIICIIMYI